MNMRPAAIFAIRDARGLSTTERTFLYTVESHGSMWCYANVAMAEMSLSRSAYYRTREQLLDRGLISARESVRRATAYEVVLEAVLALGQGSRQRDGIPPEGLEGPASGTVASHQRDLSVPPAGHIGRRPEGDSEGDLEDARARPHLLLATSGSSNPATPTAESLATLRDKVRNRAAPARGAL